MSSKGFVRQVEQGITQTGTENNGAPVIISGGLILIATPKDEYFRDFEKEA